MELLSGCLRVATVFRQFFANHVHGSMSLPTGGIQRGAGESRACAARVHALPDLRQRDSTEWARDLLFHTHRHLPTAAEFRFERQVSPPFGKQPMTADFFQMIVKIADKNCIALQRLRFLRSHKERYQTMRAGPLCRFNLDEDIGHDMACTPRRPVAKKYKNRIASPHKIIRVGRPRKRPRFGKHRRQCLMLTGIIEPCKFQYLAFAYVSNGSRFHIGKPTTQFTPGHESHPRKAAVTASGVSTGDI